VTSGTGFFHIQLGAIARKAAPQIKEVNNVATTTGKSFIF